MRVAVAGDPANSLDTTFDNFHSLAVPSGRPPQLDACPAAPGELLHHFFEHQVRDRPEQTAVVYGDESLTYAELDRRANSFAEHLGRKIGPGTFVGLLIPRGLELYAALLGVLKTGAAYVPLDPHYPAERVSYILADCKAEALITTSALVGKAGDFEGTVICLDMAKAQEAASFRNAGADVCGRLEPRLERNRPHSHLPCYAIYTSGTTGHPKGVLVEHGSACHLVKAEAEIFQVRPSDRVYQGFSLAFDASVEEIWQAFFAGATLIAAPDEGTRSGASLSRFLSDQQVTVLSCVPTLLSILEEDVPSLRLLILGGEVCPQDLVNRWWKPGRRVLNTYGPTEATVVATWSECHPNRKVTIGRPLKGYRAHLLDENLQPVPHGHPGELCLGGPGLARGYVNNPDLTQAKFVQVPFPDGSSERLYRTGDQARLNDSGEFEYLGRLDAQVKIRGFRIELTEIEAVLLQSPHIQAAAVCVGQEPSGIQHLIGYVVPRSGKNLDLERERARLKTMLPPYMVPTQLFSIDTLPTLPSGKVDRNRLAKPAPASNSAPRRRTPVFTETQKSLLAIWEGLFPAADISIDDDFFLDLAGHSLLAARMISELRRQPAFIHASLHDAYRFPTIRTLAAEFDAGPQGTEPSFQSSRQPGADDASPQTAIPGPIPVWRHLCCGIGQGIALPFILTFFALQWLTPYLAYTLLIEEEYSFFEAVLGAFASLVAFYPVMLLVPIALKWLIIGRYRAGAYPLWGSYYFRFWLVTTVEAAVPVGYLTGTPLMNLYLRLMGARVGQNVHLRTDYFGAYDLLSIGADTSINTEARLAGYTIEGGQLKLGNITIGEDCFIGTRATMGLNSELKDCSALEDLSALQSGRTVPRGETWIGLPAEKAVNANMDPVEPAKHRAPPSAPPSSRLSRFAFGVLHAAGVLSFPVLVVAALFPGIVLMNKLNYLDPYYWYLLLSPLVGVSFVALLALEIAALKWLLLGKVQPGSYPVFSLYYFRKWFVDQTMELSLEILGPLYASVYLTPWYKLLGARLGSGAEISTASFISPDLLSVGEESFIADSVSLGSARVRNGTVTIGMNQIGRRSFIGNSALLPPETTIGDDALIGCLSTPPGNPADALRPHAAWLGSPAIYLPERQHSAAFPESTTFAPSAFLRVQRAGIEFVRVITPSTGFIILLSLLFSAVLVLHDFYSLATILLLFPLLYLCCAMTATIFTISCKWLLVGRYQPGEKPLWNHFVWRNELVNALHEHLAQPFLVDPLIGTPFINWYLRLLGARIGKRVYIETTDFSEFDLVEIGDEAMLNADCTIQTHLFEDRIMKMGRISIGKGARIGAGALVLYDTSLEDNSSLGNLSLLMKGEVLPHSTHWHGNPARKLTENLDRHQSRESLVLA